MTRSLSAPQLCSQSRRNSSFAPFFPEFGPGCFSALGRITGSPLAGYQWPRWAVIELREGRGVWGVGGG